MTTVCDPLSPEAFLAPANDPSTGDWMDEVQATSASYGRYELVFDEATGRYELRDLGPQAQAVPMLEEPPAPTAITLDALADGMALELAGWASLAGPTGPSAFHTPSYWTAHLETPADLRASAALTQTGCGATWRVAAA